MSFQLVDRPNIVFLQETHQNLISVRLLKLHWFEHQFYAGGSSKARGVAIALSKGIQVQDPIILRDPWGRYIFVKCKIDDDPFTLASLYAPNTNQLAFLADTFELLSQFRVGEVLIGGDFNLILDNSLDTTRALQKRKLNKTKNRYDEIKIFIGYTPHGGHLEILISNCPAIHFFSPIPI